MRITKRKLKLMKLKDLEREISKLGKKNKSIKMTEVTQKLLEETSKLSKVDQEMIVLKGCLTVRRENEKAERRSKQTVLS